MFNALKNEASHGKGYWTSGHALDFFFPFSFFLSQPRNRRKWVARFSLLTQLWNRDFHEWVRGVGTGERGGTRPGEFSPAFSQENGEFLPFSGFSRPFKTKRSRGKKRSLGKSSPSLASLTSTWLRWGWRNRTCVWEYSPFSVLYGRLSVVRMQPENCSRPSSQSPFSGKSPKKRREKKNFRNAYNKKVLIKKNEMKQGKIIVIWNNKQTERIDSRTKLPPILSVCLRFWSRLHPENCLWSAWIS